MNAVKQDFYATVMMANLHAILIKDAQNTIDERIIKTKYPMKINKNKSSGKLKVYLISLFISHDVESILKHLHDHFIRYPIPVRKGRSFQHVRKNIQSKTKHRTFANYKPAY